MKTTTHKDICHLNTQFADSLSSNLLLYQYEALLSGYDLSGDSANCPFPLLLSTGLYRESGMKHKVNNPQNPADLHHSVDKKLTKTAPI